MKGGSTPARATPLWYSVGVTQAAPFILFWHRRGNRPAGLRAVQRVRREGPSSLRGRPLVHGLELDLKWTDDRGELLLYAHHGLTGRERLRATAVRRRAAAGDLFLIDELFSSPGAAELAFLVELKCGQGDPARALEHLVRCIEECGLGERVWLASTSLFLLDVAARVAPPLPRVLFGRTWSAGRILHHPTTYVSRSLRAHGLTPRVGEQTFDLLCTVGLCVASVAKHGAMAAAARARGVGYLPGRVTTRATLAALASGGYPAAFLYMEPGLLVD